MVRLITLNIWGGRIHDPVLRFIEKHKNKTDIFTLQEVFKSDRNIQTHGSYSNILKELAGLLPEFNFYFSPTAEDHDTRGPVNFPIEFGQATFVEHGLAIKNQKEIFVYREFNQMGPYHEDGRPDFPRNFIYTEIETEGKKFLVLNLHGFWEPAPKIDNDQRYKQSQVIIDFVKKRGLPVIIAGDFNLGIKTKALKMFEKSGFRNLVKESGALTTRSTLYNIKWRSFDKFADYILTSKGIWVTDFKVMRAKVSDHLPLYIEFDI